MWKVVYLILHFTAFCIFAFVEQFIFGYFLVLLFTFEDVFLEEKEKEFL